MKFIIQREIRPYKYAVWSGIRTCDLVDIYLNLTHARPLSHHGRFCDLVTNYKKLLVYGVMQIDIIFKAISSAIKLYLYYFIFDEYKFQHNTVSSIASNRLQENEIKSCLKWPLDKSLKHRWEYLKGGAANW